MLQRAAPPKSKDPGSSRQDFSPLPLLRAFPPPPRPQPVKSKPVSRKTTRALEQDSRRIHQPADDANPDAESRNALAGSRGTLFPSFSVVLSLSHLAVVFPFKSCYSIPNRSVAAALSRARPSVTFPSSSSPPPRTKALVHAHSLPREPLTGTSFYTTAPSQPML